MSIQTTEDPKIMIQLYCDVCIAAKNYIESESYLLDGDENSIDNNFLLDRVIVLTIEELQELGIVIEVDITELMSNGYQIDVIYYLRKNFDRFYFGEIIKKLDDVLIEQLKSCLAEAQYTSMIELLHNNLPLNDSWSFLYDNLDLYTMNSIFMAHIDAILDLNYDPDDLDDNLIPFRNQLIKTIGRRRQQCIKLANKLFKQIQIPRTFILMAIHKLNNYLLTNNMIKSLSSEDEVTTQAIILSYRRQDQGDFEYYLYNKITEPTEEQQFLLVIVNFQDGVTKQEYNDKFDFVLGDTFIDMSYIYKLIDLL